MLSLDSLSHISFSLFNSVFRNKDESIQTFKEELSDYEVSKGTVKFPMNKPIPFDLVRKMVSHRVKENLDKKK